METPADQEPLRQVTSDIEERAFAHHNFGWVINHWLMGSRLESPLLKSENGWTWQLRLECVDGARFGYHLLNLYLCFIEGETWQPQKVGWTTSIESSWVLAPINPTPIKQDMYDLEPGSEVKMNAEYHLRPNRDHEITINVELVFYGQTLPKEYKPLQTTELSADLMDLFESSEFADVTVKCGNKEFHCIKAILAARCKVFSAMFKNGTKEAQQNHVDVKDISPDVMERILRFIYSGRVPDKDDASRKSAEQIDLWAAADEYGLDGLKADCETKIVDSLTMDDICYILVMADQHSAHNMKERAINKIKRNRGMADLVKTESWKQLEKDNPDLALEVLKSAIS